MSKLNYKQIETALTRREEFKGNSCHAYLDCYGIYRVVSYTTEIASSDPFGTVWVNPQKYSVTTSKLQNIIKRVWGVN